jgi:hypothetical protein
MAGDDNPWMEGLVLTTTVGFLAGIAQTIGRWLTAASLPDPIQVGTTLTDGWRQFATVTNLPATAVEQGINRIWSAYAVLQGYFSGWTQAVPVLATPFILIVWWLFFAIVAFAAARTMGGKGSLNSTLGAVALIVAPQVITFLSFIPFVAVSGALLAVWGALIGYRAVQVAHGLSWQRAAFVTLIPYAGALLLLPLLGTAFALGFTAGGYR